MPTIIYLILLIACLPASIMLWLILGVPRIRVRKPWQPSAIVDGKLSGDEETQSILDECERAIS